MPVDSRRQRHVAEFIDNQQLHRGQLPLKPEQAALVTRLHELVDQRGRRGERDREALLAGCQSESQGDVRLAGAGVAERDDVLPTEDVAAARQLQHEHLVQARDGGEVEGVEALHRREACRPDPALDHAPFAVDQFQLNQPQQIAGVVEAAPGAVPGDLVVLAQDRRQLQLLEVMGEQDARCRLIAAHAHAATSGTSTV